MREVDEALREQQMQDVAKKYGVPITILVVLIIAGVGGWLWWDGSQTAAQEDRGERYTMALDRIREGQPESADDLLAKLATEEASDTAVLARLTQAGVALEAGKTDEAIKTYDAIAADGDVPEMMRDLATIRGVAAQYDDLEPQAVIDRLKPLAVAGNPWFGSAGEMVAMAYLAQGKDDLAGPLFGELARNQDVPESIRRRAGQMAGILGVDSIDDTDEALERSGLTSRAPAAPPQ